MSEMETHKGKLIPMILNGVTQEERARSACETLGYEPTGAHDSWLDCLRDDGYRKVLICDDVIYKVQDIELDSYGFSEVTKNEDGTLDYFVSYYNGGASFDEVVQSAMENNNE